MNKLLELINVLESKIPHWETLNTSVSQSPVGWHIQHALLATKKITSALANSNPNKYKWKFNFSRSYVFTFNKIPRGKGEAPKSVLPDDPFDASALLRESQIVKSKVSDLNTLKANNYFEHPFFGSLNLKSAIKFLEIHTALHISIINDIIK